jgi:hypothetical protein
LIKPDLQVVHHMNSRAVAALNAAAAFRLRAKDAATRPELKRVALSACRYAQASTVCFGRHQQDIAHRRRPLVGNRSGLLDRCSEI